MSHRKQELFFGGFKLYQLIFTRRTIGTSWAPAFVLLFSILSIPSAALSEPAPGSNCALVAAAMEVASDVRGLRERRKVPCRLQNRKQVEQYLRDTIRTKIPQKRLLHEGISYKMLGLIPADFNYEEGLIELYTSQLGGYYDADKDFYAMADWMPEVMQFPIAVHELTHALQDQHFRLDNLLDQKTEVSDALLARSALVEGDATAVMLDYSRKLMGQGPLAAENSVTGVMMQNIAGAMLSSSLTNAPPALQSILMFPYVSGLNFVHAVLRHGGYKSIDSCFAKLPASTEEILHPDKYFSGKRDFQEIEHSDISALVNISLGEPVFTDRIGEFVISTILSQGVPPSLASMGAAGWGGDRLELYEVGKGRYVLHWISHWDSLEDAQEFFQQFTTTLEGRFGGAVKTVGSVSIKASPFGSISLQHDHKSVRFLIQPS